MAFGGIAPTPDGDAVVLTDEGARRGLLLRPSGMESWPIALRVGRAHADHHPANDWLGSRVRKSGGEIVSVLVDRIENDMLYGSVLLAKQGGVVKIDAPASDAVALALGSAVPLFVSESVLTQSGIDVGRYDFRRIRQPTVAPRPGEVAL